PCDLTAHGGPGVALARAVAIDSQHPRRIELAGERRLDPLRPLTHRREILIAALGAGRRDGRLVTAVVATHPLILEVQHELRGAAVAARDPPAAAAGEHRREAAAVDEYEALLAARPGPPGRRGQARR